MKFILSTDVKSDLISKAQSACKKAYDPYSKLCVGSSILTKAGNVYEGCNVENSSYSLTICAERNAIFQAVMAEGKNMRLKVIVVTTLSNEMTFSPCGACRQVIAEFGDNVTVIYKIHDEWIDSTIELLLPNSFKLL